MTENKLLTHKHVLLHDNQIVDIYQTSKFDYLIGHFCGRMYNVSEFDINHCSTNIIIYWCRDIKFDNNSQYKIDVCVIL